MCIKISRVVFIIFSLFEATSCIDESSSCEYYASNGYCNMQLYIDGVIIAERCSASCNPNCKTTGPQITTSTLKPTTITNPTCTDFNSALCQTYATKGYCSLNIYVNSALIAISCAASCNPQCKSPTTAAPQTTTTTTTLKPTTTTTVKSPTCTDFNSDLCQQYKSKGYCLLNVYVNGALITTSCAASCNPSCSVTSTVKTTTTINKCSDYNSSLCQTYASKGYCSLNIYINNAPIKVSCAFSCNSCI